MALRRVSPNQVKLNRSYSASELADLLGVHKNTVRQWRRDGLDAIDQGRPALFQAAAARAFLTARE